MPSTHEPASPMTVTPPSDGSVRQFLRPSGRRVRTVSIVTVCLNAETTIERTLASVAMQSCPGIGIEQLVIDGGSTDATVERARRFRPQVLTSEPDDGIYAAMQKGALRASGDIVFFLNSGDALHDRTVLQDVAGCFDRWDCDGVFGNLLPCDSAEPGRHDHVAFTPGVPLDFSYFCNRRFFYDGSIHHQTTFYRRSVFEQSGFMAADPRANGEYHLNLSAFVERGLPAKHMARIVCAFSLGGRSTADFAVEWRRFSEARRILRARFFPGGRDAVACESYEYLQVPPPWPQRVRYRLRSHPARRWLADTYSTLRAAGRSAG